MGIDCIYLRSYVYIREREKNEPIVWVYFNQDNEREIERFYKK